MLKAFVDDSGSGGDSPWYVLAGYVGTVEGWGAFDNKWRGILGIEPAIEHFKASEIESLPKDERDVRLDALTDVIGECATRAFYVRTRQQDYNEVIKPYVPPYWDNAYFYLFIGCIAAATSLEKYAGSSRPIEFVFDSGCKKRIENPALRLYGQIKDIPQFQGRIANVHYEDDKEFLPLQASDLLAWQIRRRFCVTDEPPRRHFERALNKPRVRPYDYTISRSELQSYSELMDRVAKERWELTGKQESERPWKRPRKDGWWA